MNGFRYQAATADGRMVAGRMQAASVTEVRRRLHRDGLFPVEVREAAEGRPRAAGRLSLERLFRSDRALALQFTRELSTLLGAGFSLDRSLGLLEEVLSDERGVAVVSTVRERVREGKPFSEALGEFPNLFSRFYLSTVRAGEEAGALGPVIARLAAHLERTAEVRSRVASTLVYPAIMTAVGGAAVLVLLFGVIPKFVEILEGANQALPLSTAVVVGVSRLAGDWWWAGLLLAGAAAVALARYRATEEGRRRLDDLLLRAPLVGPLVVWMQTARFCRTLATLRQSGVSFLPAVDAAADTVQNAVLRDILAEAREGVQKGRPMAEPLESSSRFPRLAARMIRVGEESGELEQMLENVGEIYERRVRERTERLVSLLEPALIVVFGVVVGFVALAMLEAIFSINEVPF